MARPTRVAGLNRSTLLVDAGPRLIGARLGDVVSLARQVSRRADPTGVHDLRVATRRLRVALWLFGGPALEELSGRAKRLQDALGAVRDLEIELEWLAAIARTHPFAEPMLTATRQQIALRQASLARTLAGWQRPPPASEIQRALGHPGGKLGGRKMRAALRKRLLQADHRMEALRDRVDARDAHRARIAVKKLRYLAELLEPAFPGAARRLLDSLVKPQDDLGDFHDASRWVARWSPPQRRRGAPRLAASRLAGLATERLKRAQIQVQKDVRRWIRSRVASRIASLLAD